MPTNFNDSFRWRAPLREGCKHGWEHHAYTGTFIRLLLARLDFLAAKDKGRFVFATLPALLKMCNKGKAKGECYGMKHLLRALAEFRARHIVSPYFTRWDGQYGFVMEPHVAGKGRAHLVGNMCVLDAYRDERPLDETSQGSPHDAPKTAFRGDSGATQGRQRGDPGATTGRPRGDNGATLGATLGATDELAQIYQNDELVEEYARKLLLKITPQEGLDFKSVSLLVPESPSSLSSLPASRDQKFEQNNSNDKSKTEPKVKSDGLTSKASRLTDPGATPTATPAPMKTQSETVGEYFRGCLSISLLTAGELDDGCCFEDKNLLEQLQECMTEAVAAKADRPFCGNITCAALMGDTMNLLLETYERKVPAPWVPVMRLLREQTPKAPSQKVKDILSRAATRPIVRLVPEDFHIKNGCERCEDEIWRAESDRTAQGFTVKDTYVAPANGKTYNIWRKVKE